MAKTAQLQIRVTPTQKTRLKQLAAQAGQPVSEYVLSRTLPPERERWSELLQRLARADDHRYALAELHDLLDALARIQFAEVLEQAPSERLSSFLQNYVAAMVEHAAARKGVRAPAWVDHVAPLAAPHFATPLASLRLHLLRSAPVAFKRRNIFVDSAVGDRV
jgi:uncharacterized protein (DUF1778 family)